MRTVECMPSVCIIPILFRFCVSQLLRFAALFCGLLFLLLLVSLVFPVLRLIFSLMSSLAFLHVLSAGCRTGEARLAKPGLLNARYIDIMHFSSLAVFPLLFFTVPVCCSFGALLQFSRFMMFRRPLPLSRFTFFSLSSFRNVIFTVGPRFHEKYKIAAENALHGCYRCACLLHTLAFPLF